MQGVEWVCFCIAGVGVCTWQYMLVHIPVCTCFKGYCHLILVIFKCFLASQSKT